MLLPLCETGVGHLPCNQNKNAKEQRDHLMRTEALQQVRQLPAVAKVEQELLDGSTSVDFGDHARIDTVKHSGHTNEQSWLHLTCTDEHESPQYHKSASSHAVLTTCNCVQQLAHFV